MPSSDASAGSIWNGGQKAEQGGTMVSGEPKWWLGMKIEDVETEERREQLSGNASEPAKKMSGSGNQSLTTAKQTRYKQRQSSRQHINQFIKTLSRIDCCEKNWRGNVWKDRVLRYISNSETAKNGSPPRSLPPRRPNPTRQQTVLLEFVIDASVRDALPAPFFF